MFFAYGEAELACLRARDKRLREVIDKIGHVDRVVDTDLFSAVVHHIIGQQISTKAQATIWQRMQDALGTVNAETILAAGVPKLQALGMTFRKAEYITDFAERVHSGTFDPEGIRQKSDEDAIRELSALKGIGVWTAEMILLFCMQRPNIFSYDDLAIQRGLRMVYHHRKIDRKLFEKYRRRFSPIAAWPACTCGPWQAERSRKCAIINRKTHDKKETVKKLHSCLIAYVGRPLVARQLTAATHFLGQFSCKANGHGRAMLAPTRVFRQSEKRQPTRCISVNGSAVLLYFKFATEL